MLNRQLNGNEIADFWKTGQHVYPTWPFIQTELAVEFAEFCEVLIELVALDKLEGKVTTEQTYVFIMNPILRNFQNLFECQNQIVNICSLP